MAAVTSLGSSFTTTSGTKTVTATPAVGDLIVIVTAHTGNTSAAAPTDNNNGGTYSLINSAVKASSADTMRVWVRNAPIGSASSTVFTHAPGTSTGGGLVVLKVTGMTRCQRGAIRQSAIQSNQAAGGTPTPVLGSAALTGNALIGAVFNATSPATMTPRSSPAWTERNDSGYSTPTAGLETMSIDSGETGTSIAWGGTSASAFCSLVIELDASVPPSECQAERPFGDGYGPGIVSHQSLMGTGALFTLSAILNLTPPVEQPVAVAAHYETGTHQAAIHHAQNGSRFTETLIVPPVTVGGKPFTFCVAEYKESSQSSVTEVLLVPSAPGPSFAFIETALQLPGPVPSGTWGQGVARTVVDSAIVPDVVGEQEEPRYQPSSFWRQAPTPAATTAPVTSFIRTAQEWAITLPSGVLRQQPYSTTPTDALPSGADYRTGQHSSQYDYAGLSVTWHSQIPSGAAPQTVLGTFLRGQQEQPGINTSQIKGDVSQYAALLVLVQRPAITTQAEVPLVAPSFVKRSLLAAVDAPVIPSLGSYPQELPFSNSSWLRTDASQYAELLKQILRPTVSSVGDYPQVTPSAVMPAWAFTPPAQQAPPNRPTTFESFYDSPQYQPSNLWYAQPPSITPTDALPSGADYRTGQHSLVYEYAGLSAVWKYKSIASVTPDNPPNRPTTFKSYADEARYQPGSLWYAQPPSVAAPVSPPNRPWTYTVQEYRGSVSNAAIWNTSIWGVSVPLVVSEVVGDFDPPPYQPSKIWGYPGFAAPAVQNPPNRPLIQTRLDTGPYEARNYSAVWITVNGTVVDAAVISDVVSDFDPPPYQPISFWGHLPHAMPLPPDSPPNRPLVQTQQETGLHASRIHSLVWGNPGLPSVVVENPPLRSIIQTQPQPDIQLRPSRVWGRMPPTALRPPRFAFHITYPTERYFLDTNKSVIIGLGARGIPSEIYLVGTQIAIYQGTLTPEVQRHVARVVTQPKYQGATQELTPCFNFANALEAGETLTGATVSATVYTGIDASPSNILVGSPTINGANVHQMMTAGIVGVVYDLKCTASTSLGQILIQNTYFYVEPDLP